MRTCKIIDTCTLINLFCENGPDISQCLSDYDVVITDIVVKEYTRKYPRIIPNFIKVIEINEEDKTLMDDLELLMPRLGPGERSSYIVMIRLAKIYDKVVLLTDDIRATKKLKQYVLDDPSFNSKAEIIWGNTVDLVGKFIHGESIRN